MKSLRKPCYNTLRRGYTATHELARVAAEAKHNIILIYRRETKNFHNTNGEWSKASYSKATSPARSLDKHPPLAALGLGPLDADAGVGQIQALQCAVFLQSFGQYLAVNKHRRDRTWWKRISPLIQCRFLVVDRTRIPFSETWNAHFQCHKLVCKPLLLRPIMWTCSPHLSTQLHTCWLVWHEGSIRWSGAWPHAPREQVSPPRSPRPQPLCRQNRSSSGRGRRGSWWTSETPQWPGQNKTWPVDSPVLKAFCNKEMLICHEMYQHVSTTMEKEKKNEAIDGNDSVQLLWKSASPKWLQ